MDTITVASAAGDASQPVGAPLDLPVLGRRNLLVAGTLFMAALLIIWGFEALFQIPIAGVSSAPHFVYQAYSFLHGRWDLDLPAQQTDIIVLHGKHYIVYPPGPAVLMMPFVAIWGLHTSDILFTTVFAAANLSLMFLLFEQVRASGFTRRPCMENVVIAILLYFGSINLWLSLGGRMWFTAHILCMTFALAALLVALRRHFAWSAALLGIAFFCRSTVVLGLPVIFYLAWQDGGTQHLVERFLSSVRGLSPDWTAVPWRRLLAPALVIAGVVVLFMARNAAVFGSPFDTGYATLIQQRYPEVTTGPFSLSYVPANIVANFFSFPQIIFHSPFDRHPTLNVANSGYCVSVFITTPLFFFLFWRNKRFSALRAVLWVSIGLIVAAVLLFHASGWIQFGARYLYDGYAFAFLLLVLNEVRVDWRFAALGLFAVLLNLLGAVQFWTGIVPQF
jgi:hypothetical protein